MELAKAIPPSLLAYNDVYEDDMLFRETVADILESLDVDSSPKQFGIGVDLVKDAVGRDVAKLHAMFDVVHARIVKRWSWATGPAIDFYRLVFLKVDMSILEDNESEVQAKSGVAKAADHIVRRCVTELDIHDDWNSAQVRCETHFVLKAFKNDNSFITAQDAFCSLLSMAESWNILVNSNNITVFAKCFRNTVSKIQLFGLQDKLKVVSERIRELPNQTQLYDEQLQTIRGVLEEFTPGAA
ncbi:hypothetical protein BKA63DRAFT_606819 [Paraphoma chrysanthemicola]|nr:hypothetical protein BKA63DRAFT_606819 [Paraphoma chrysanthemicola]